MNKLYQIKIQLEEIDPPVWRRVIIPCDMLLSDFHKVIQTIMGWTNSHLHLFEINDTYYQPRIQDDWTWDEKNNVDYKETRVSDLLFNENDQIIYEYDPGDYWIHNILLEKITENPKGTHNPKCIDGQRSCPPENSGGTQGYRSLLQVISNPKHVQYKSYIRWLGRVFDPEYFSPKQVNILLKRKNFGLQ
jgi:hypothetical protein